MPIESIIFTINYGHGTFCVVHMTHKNNMGIYFNAEVIIIHYLHRKKT